MATSSTSHGNRALPAMDINLLSLSIFQSPWDSVRSSLPGLKQGLSMAMLVPALPAMASRPDIHKILEVNVRFF